MKPYFATATIVVALFTPLLAQEGMRPAESPLSWNRGESRAWIGKSAQLFGFAELPSTVESVKLSDTRPYGEGSSNNVTLLRFSGETGRPAVPLNIALGVTGGVYAAFTDAAPLWATATLPGSDIMGSVTDRLQFFAADYEHLQSSVADVLERLPAALGVKLEHTGQVIIRPRRAVRRVPSEDPESGVSPRNVWVVEILGTLIEKRTVFGAQHALTTHVAVLRDGDLQYMCGAILP